MQGACAPSAESVPQSLKPGQCIIDTPSDLFFISAFQNVWLHNLFLRHRPDSEGRWASNTLIRSNGTNLYLTNVAMEGSGLEYDGPSFEHGVRVASSRIFALGVAHHARRICSGADHMLLDTKAEQEVV
jgi:hypothetical protein